MTDRQKALFTRDTRSEWLRLRTFILLRWLAITGQIIAIFVARRHYGLQLELGFVYMVIGASVVANLVFIFVYPENKRLSELQAALMLLFDIFQLSALLFLTGGLHNPFSLLVIAPVTISATALGLRSTIILGVIAMALTTVLTTYHVSLRTEAGEVLRMPEIFVFGFWVAIVSGTIFLSIYARRVASEIHSMSEALLATQMALSREQKLTDLGGVVAAAAHELGTPLATIKLTSAELMDELADRPDLREDAELIRDQSDRCREILRSMGRAGKNDLHMRSAPISAIIEEAAEPHMNRGKTVRFDFAPKDNGGAQPVLVRQPEVIHGLRNLIQNAVDFADHNVWLQAYWTQSKIMVRIADDGPGYPSHLIGRIGEPFVRNRRSYADRERRPEYDSMGLGLFIAKTLLERSGAEVEFGNGSDPFLARDDQPEQSGAIINIIWPRGAGGLESAAYGHPLGENQPIRA
ncbi:MAG: sensor histidine kinase RegB [Halocynthiibacter sp.]